MCVCMYVCVCVSTYVNVHMYFFAGDLTRIVNILYIHVIHTILCGYLCINTRHTDKSHPHPLSWHIKASIHSCVKFHVLFA